MKILFIDDSPERRKVFKSNSIGFIVDFAENADSAIELFSKNTYNLIYIDHDLEDSHYDNPTDQDKNGAYIAKELLKNENNNNSTIIIHSLNENGRKNIKSILNSKYKYIYTPEDFGISFLWKISINDILSNIMVIENQKMDLY